MTMGSRSAVRTVDARREMAPTATEATLMATIVACSVPVVVWLMGQIKQKIVWIEEWSRC